MYSKIEISISYVIFYKNEKIFLLRLRNATRIIEHIITIAYLILCNNNNTAIMKSRMIRMLFLTLP